MRKLSVRADISNCLSLAQRLKTLAMKTPGKTLVKFVLAKLETLTITAFQAYKINNI